MVDPWGHKYEAIDYLLDFISPTPPALLASFATFYTSFCLSSPDIFLMLLSLLYTRTGRLFFSRIFGSMLPMEGWGLNVLAEPKTREDFRVSVSDTFFCSFFGTSVVLAVPHAKSRAG